MGKYTEILDAIKNAENFDARIQMAQYFLGILERVKDDLYSDERADITDFALAELETLPALIEGADCYKKKRAYFDYEDSLLGFVTIATGYVGELPQEKLEMVKKVVELVASEMFLENAVDDLFKQEEIGVAETEDLIKLVSEISEPFHRGLLYRGLLEYKDSVGKMSDDAWKAMSDYIASELDAYIAKGDALTADESDAVEIAVDVCKVFLNDKISEKLVSLLGLRRSNVSFYAVRTLLEAERDVPATAIDALARDLEYADMTYGELEKFGKTSLFPTELANPEYLAKSNMVHWLVYPTELGKQPDEIECIGSIKIKKELYHIFRYKSDSENLTDDLKNEWLIGWSSNDGGTFSEFDLYADYEKKTPEKTVKYIKRKLIK